MKSTTHKNSSGDRRVLMGLSNRNLAILMIVIAMETFFLLYSVMFPKAIFRKRAAFLIPVSPQLFVGSIAEYF
jgi:hypothetical protein